MPMSPSNVPVHKANVDREGEPQGQLPRIVDDHAQYPPIHPGGRGRAALAVLPSRQAEAWLPAEMAYITGTLGLGNTEAQRA